MTTPMLNLPEPGTLAAALKRKRVLLVDASAAKRDLRAETMRKLGIDVDCAADISEARSWWRADLYNLVLLNIENDLGHRDRFCEEIRNATPPQQLAFLVGKPEYVADLPSAGSDDGIEGNLEPISQPAEGADAPADASGNPSQRWGILEASRRISEVRSVFAARLKATRERPMPPRDSETRSARSMSAQRTTNSHSLEELLREELL
jgi:CheY-like chemotaxis protein